MKKTLSGIGNLNFRSVCVQTDYTIQVNISKDINNILYKNVYIFELEQQQLVRDVCIFLYQYPHCLLILKFVQEQLKQHHGYFETIISYYLPI